jgi:hypothetical protein
VKYGSKFGSTSHWQALSPDQPGKNRSGRDRTASDPQRKNQFGRPRKNGPAIFALGLSVVMEDPEYLDANCVQWTPPT